MIKKQYTKPTIETVKISHRESLLLGSQDYKATDVKLVDPTFDEDNENAY